MEKKKLESITGMEAENSKYSFFLGQKCLKHAVPSWKKPGAAVPHYMIPDGASFEDAAAFR